MSNIQFTTIDRMFAKFGRELRGTDINESDVIEWIGEALGFMKMPEAVINLGPDLCVIYK